MFPPHQATYGRNRQSIATIDDQLRTIFLDHPKSHINDSGEPAIPADALVDIFRSFSDVSNSPLLSEEELTLLKSLLADNPGLEVTPQILLQFIAEKTRASPPRSPNSDDDMQLLPTRGRGEERDDYSHYHRSSSNESNGTSYYRSSGSRPSSRGPQTPNNPKSPFDTERRQRSTPLANNAPSSWSKRPAPAHRRKSDAGSRSDSEVPHFFPVTLHDAPTHPIIVTVRRPTKLIQQKYQRTRSRTIKPHFTLHIIQRPKQKLLPDRGRTFSRPHSRAQSQPINNYGYDEHGYSSPDDNNHTLNASRSNPSGLFIDSISSLPMPRANRNGNGNGNGDDSDSDPEDSLLGLVMDRSTTSSTVSLEPLDRLDALQRANADLNRKCMEAERTLQHKLSEHELELEEMQSRLEEVRSELAHTKREEKELRSKDISSMEQEISRLNKQLEHSRSTYSSLNKQYQDQCAASEKYRDELRTREEQLRTLKESAALQEVEALKYAKEHENYEARILQLEADLSIAQQAHEQLDEQKHENMLLKETIDRMRFDMDEMRNAAVGGVVGYGVPGSAPGSVSKSLGAEMLGKMKWLGEEGQDEAEVGDVAAEGEGEDDTEGEEEEEIQTIITRKKRKVASRANAQNFERREFEEAKDYSDSCTQYDPVLFAVSHSTQTDPEPKILTVSFSTQTEDVPTRIFAVQTESRRTAEMEIQTDDIVILNEVSSVEGTTSSSSPEQRSRSPSPLPSSSSSSSMTIIPGTPKPHAKQLLEDQPPAYGDITTSDQQQDRERRIAAEILQEWHQGVKIPFQPVEGGISEEAAREWQALKEELGVQCAVIDKIVASSERASSSRKDQKRRSKFYNIYNTYVYGGGDKSSSSNSYNSVTIGMAGQALMVVGVSALAMLVMSPYMVPHYSVPGGATYYDRTAWHSFNSMQAAGEGFSPDGTAAVWNFLGRVGGGAARIARGWPT
ncbi:uncharacterized protein LACBIDRAFT_329462 [Laccaria bicolor S238N-H82]|uniref:Predicted protein n=1 Tax=Laccaria bicolor (strain S238N-H82 / ATCC MYA-4686) TaxID=486041 RepID=B0DI38_LACBS|nr:uncharacterized protein LACBIDRAFT_329462 [Laccaria bicolor S238N-H82]EDR05936.1 predicted protein [Laccaria bicolor S238N-H82]|eukprot:XP_001883612.1 predicted protein [Laccaria bicolor S238N-H82]